MSEPRVGEVMYVLRSLSRSRGNHYSPYWEDVGFRYLELSIEKQDYLIMQPEKYTPMLFEPFVLNS